MVVGVKALVRNLGEGATCADLGSSSKYSKVQSPHVMPMDSNTQP